MKVINPNNLPVVKMSEVKATQGDLKFLSKENYYKLKKNIEKHGFDIPITVWIDEQGVKHLLDGHQRKHVLDTEGWSQPVPYLVIEAKTLNQAAERLLEITSQYGTITQEGIDEFMATFELPEMEMRELTNFDGIFDLPPLPEVEDEPEVPEEEPQAEIDSVEGMYAIGPHRVLCGTEKGEVPPAQMDAYRKKYHRTMTGGDDGWQDATTLESEGL